MILLLLESCGAPPPWDFDSRDNADDDPVPAPLPPVAVLPLADDTVPPPPPRRNPSNDALGCCCDGTLVALAMLVVFELAAIVACKGAVLFRLRLLLLAILEVISGEVSCDPVDEVVFIAPFWCCCCSGGVCCSSVVSMWCSLMIRMQRWTTPRHVNSSRAFEDVGLASGDAAVPQLELT